MPETRRLLEEAFNCRCKEVGLTRCPPQGALLRLPAMALYSRGPHLALEQERLCGSWWHPALGFVSPKGLQVNSLSCSRAEQGTGGWFCFLWL